MSVTVIANRKAYWFNTAIGVVYVCTADVGSNNLRQSDMSIVMDHIVLGGGLRDSISRWILQSAGFATGNNTHRLIGRSNHTGISVRGDALAWMKAIKEAKKATALTFKYLEQETVDLSDPTAVSVANLDDLLKALSGVGSYKLYVQSFSDEEQSSPFEGKAPQIFVPTLCCAIGPYQCTEFTIAGDTASKPYSGYRLESNLLREFSKTFDSNKPLAVIDAIEAEIRNAENRIRLNQLAPANDTSEQLSLV